MISFAKFGLHLAAVTDMPVTRRITRCLSMCEFSFSLMYVPIFDVIRAVAVHNSSRKKNIKFSQINWE